MTVIGLGTKKKRRLPLLPLLSGSLMLASLILFSTELVRFAQSRDRLQTDITVAGVSVSGLTQSQAVTTWESVYNQSITLEYLNSPILLSPADVGFRINSQQMQEEIRAKSSVSGNYWVDFWNYLWRRPSTPITVALTAGYSEARLRAFLEDVSVRYDQVAGSAGFDAGTMTFNSGSTGRKLDIDRSMEAIEKALFRPDDRTVRLVMQNEGARAADMATLRQAILDFLDRKTFNPFGPETLASVGVIDLQTGQEMWINEDIAYSAMSTIKIPIMVNFYAQKRFAIETGEKWLLAGSILCSLNDSSNFLMQIPGEGVNERDKLADGLSQVSETAMKLGADYTFLNAPLWVGQQKYQFSINDNPPPVPNPKYDAKPDIWSRTTARDMAVLLHGLYDCGEYGSGFAAILPERFNQAKCKQMIELLSGNVINRLIELGVPLGTKVVHKNGWGGTPTRGANVSDAAIVYTPGGNYILVAYVWEAKANQDGLATSLIGWESIEGISQIVYNFFNPTTPMTVPRVPDNPFGAIDCVMPNPAFPERLDLNNIWAGRFDDQGKIERDACYGFPACGQDPIPARLRPGSTG